MTGGMTRPSRLLARAVLGILVLSLALLAAPRPAHAAYGMELALQDDAVLLQRLYYDRDRALDQIRGLGVSRVRSNLLWSSVLHGQARLRRQPKHLRYDWSAYDALVVAAAQHGMAVQFNLTGPAPAFAPSNHRLGPPRPSAKKIGPFAPAAAPHLTGPAPAFATSNHRIGPRRPSAKKFGQFARAAATHFRGHVDRYAIWNEPNYVGWLAPVHSAPKLYRHLYQAGYAGVKRADGGA